MRIIRQTVSEPRTPRLTAKEYAARAMFERSLSRYVLIKCGHLTTPDVQLIWANWKPKGRVFFCEACDKWLPQMPKPKPSDTSDVPLF